MADNKARKVKASLGEARESETASGTSSKETIVMVRYTRTSQTNKDGGWVLEVSGTATVNGKDRELKLSKMSHDNYESLTQSVYAWVKTENLQSPIKVSFKKSVAG
tara:strand:- start:16820 stop:17137 length:318 start_codon:yes stop_codon:yes gene_type:complete